MEHTSYIELSRSALANNLLYLKKTLGPDCVISHVVKGNAYGHGIKEFVPLACDLGAKHFSTFDAAEALEVYKCNGNIPNIMIMGMIDNQQLEWAVENSIEFFVFEITRIKGAIAAAKKINKKALIHLEIETGMNRTGFNYEELMEVHKLLKENNDYLMVKGICTHYAGAEDFTNLPRIKSQITKFKEAVAGLKKEGLKAEMLHTACSAASIRLPDTRMDMVRIGILQYGFWPSPETYITTVKPEGAEEDPLQRIISWKSHVMSIKKVGQDNFVGYGTSYLATKNMELAAVPVGYGHGFSRSLSNQGRALVRGERVSVVGTVNMNVMMLDVTGIGVETGDEVVLIGKQGERSISVSSFSNFSDQLNYELLTRLPQRIPRYIVN